MHASIWRFKGDPDDLLRRYDAVVAEIPAANMRLHLCLRADDGIIVVDTCPDRETYEAFVAGAIRGLFRPTACPIRKPSRTTPCTPRSSTAAAATGGVGVRQPATPASAGDGPWWQPRRPASTSCPPRLGVRPRVRKRAATRQPEGPIILRR